MKNVILFLTLIFLGFSCSSQKMIEGTNIKDTDDNKVIYNIIIEYNKALEGKDAEKLMTLVSKRYYDSAGTIDGSDDYGYSQLKEILEKRFAQVKEIFQNITIKKIFHNKSEKKYYVSYEYNAKFLMDVDGKKEWHKKIDVNQIVLVKEGDEFKIIKGL